MKFHLSDKNISDIKITIVKKKEIKKKEPELPIWLNREYTSLNFNNPTLPNWNPNTFDWKHYSKDLCNFQKLSGLEKDFKKWWDPDKFNWKTGSGALAYRSDSLFEIWWDPDKFDWKTGSGALANSCSSHFKIWWDPDKFDWETESVALAYNCVRYFEIWWDPNKFNWERCSKELILHCSKYIHIWWDPDKADWKYFSELVQNNFNIKDLELWWNSDRDWFSSCDKLIKKTTRAEEYTRRNDIDTMKKIFHIWWDPNKFNWENYSNLLCEKLYSLFSLWWDPNKFPLEYQTDNLIHYCHADFDVWWKYKNSLVLSNKSYHYLSEYCSNNIEQWWNKKKYPTTLFPVLIKYCSDNFNVWWKPNHFRYSSISLVPLIKYSSHNFPEWYDESILALTIKDGLEYNEILEILINTFKKNKVPKDLKDIYYNVYEIVQILYKDYYDLWKNDMLIYRIV